MLVTMVVASGIMLLWPMIGRRFSGVNDVGTLEATQLINHKDAMVLDVREDSEFASGRIPRSKHIPLGQVANRIQELDKFKDKPIVVSCRSGNRSSSACVALRKHGFTQVYNLRGGMIAWEQANLPVEK